MFNCKEIKSLSVGLAALALTVTIGYISTAGAEPIKASVAQPALRTDYKSSDSIQLDGAVSLTNGERKISVSLRDSDLKQALRMIADKAGLNIIFHSSVEGTVTLDLVNVTLNDAFKMIMQASDLSYMLDKGTLLVMSKDASLESDISKQNMMIIPVKYGDAAKIAEFLNNNVFSTNRPGLSNNKIVVTNPGTNELVLFGTKNDYAMAQKIVAKLDTKPVTATYRVNYTTPKEMANLICQSLFPESEGAAGGSGGGGGGFMTGGAAEVGGGSGGGAAGSGKAIEMGAGKLACSIKVNASKDGGKLTNLGDRNLSVMYFPTTGVINVTGGSESQREMIAQFIKDNDRKQPQAFMEMQIIELNETGSKTFNNTWDMFSPFFSAGFGNTGLTTNNKYPTFFHGNGYDVLDEDMQVDYRTSRYKGPVTLSYKINYLIENGKGRVLANPKLIVTNGQESLIDLTSDYIESTEAQIMATGGIAGGVQKTYNIEKDNGISVAMTPFISPDGYVTLNLTPKYATIKEQVMDNYYDETSGTSTPIIAATLLQRRNLDLSNIRIKDGETLVIGGMIQETETKNVQKLPFLGDLPYIGSFFRNTTTNNEKSELVIMLTPRIIKDSEDVNVTDNL